MVWRPTRAPVSYYLDTSAIDHLVKREGISEPEVREILAAVGDRGIVVLSSLVVVEEAVGTFARCAELAVRQLRLIHDMTEHFIKPASILLKEAIHSHMTRSAQPTPFFENPSLLRARIWEWIQAPSAELLTIASETKVQKKAFRGAMRAARAKTMPAVDALRASDTELPFRRYLRQMSPEYASGIPERIGVRDGLMAGGALRLLKNKVVRVAVGYMASYTYSQTVEKEKPRHGDSRDQEHAICASAADVLVTDDAEFARLFNRVGDVEAIALKTLAVRAFHVARR